MSGFQVGDVVVCVDDRISPGSPVVPVVEGEYYRVSGVIRAIAPHDIFGTDGGGVFLAGMDWLGGFAAARFRKLPKADQRFTEQMRALKPSTVSA